MLFQGWQKDTALGQRLGVTDHGAHPGQGSPRNAQQVLPDGQITHPGHDQTRVGVQQIQHGGNIPGIGIFKGKYPKFGVAVLYGIKDLAPGGKRYRP